MTELKDVIETLDQAADSFDGIATKEQKKIYDEVIVLAKDLETDVHGKVKQSIANLKRLTQIKAKLAALSKDKEWVAGITRFAQYFGHLQKMQNEYYSQHFTESTLGVNAQKKNQLMREMAVQNTMEALMGDGLKANVTDKLNDILLRAVTSGAKFADLQDELRAHLMGENGGKGAFARYATTYATTALSQFAGQTNKLMTDDLGLEWFMYTGSNKETTREFCEHLTAKKYIHKSEIPTILTGKIDDYQCAIYEKTGLPLGMIAGTTPENFQCNCGGWNCRHQLVPVHELAVPADIRAKFKQIKPTAHQSSHPKEGKDGKEGLKLGRAQEKQVQQQIENIQLAKLNPAQIENVKYAADKLGINPKKPMEFRSANERRANVDYKPRTETEENCSLCVVVYEMRRRGLDITALPFDEKNKIMDELQRDYTAIWRNEKGNKPGVTAHRGQSFDEMKRKMLAQCKSVGRYHIGLNWTVFENGKQVEKGHVLTAERLQDDSFIIYDPQDGSFVNIDEYDALYSIDYIESIKVDRLVVDVEMLRAISRPL